MVGGFVRLWGLQGFLLAMSGCLQEEENSSLSVDPGCRSRPDSNYIVICEAKNMVFSFF